MIKVELKKGFVGITADGRKATIESDPTPRNLIWGVIEGDEPNTSRNWNVDGSRDLKKNGLANLRIVAPYPSERPFENYLSGVYVLNTRDGSIVVAKVIGAKDDEFKLQGPPEAEWRYWFRRDGKGYTKSAHLRVLGPVEEEKPAPEAPKKRGMTRKRLREIESVLPEAYASGANARGFQNMLREVIEWINASESHTLRFDPEEHEYEPHDIASMAEEMKRFHDHTLLEGHGNSCKIIGLQMDGVRASYPGGQFVITWKELLNYRWFLNDLPVARIKKDGNDESTRTS